MEERRAFQRIKISVSVWHGRAYKNHAELRKEESGPEQFSVTKDISAGGLVFISNETMPVGSIVEIKIEIPGVSGFIECTGRVVRTEKKGQDGAYEVAVCFLDLKSADRKKLDDFVKKEAD